MKNIFEALRNTVTESDVQGIYTQSLKELLNVNKVEHPYQCDSLIETEDKQVKLIVEYKYDEDLSSKMGRASVLIQVLYYLKRFEQNGELLPNVFMPDDNKDLSVFENIYHNGAPYCYTNRIRRTHWGEIFLK